MTADVSGLVALSQHTALTQTPNMLDSRKPCRLHTELSLLPQWNLAQDSEYGVYECVRASVCVREGGSFKDFISQCKPHGDMKVNVYNTASSGIYCRTPTSKKVLFSKYIFV